MSANLLRAPGRKPAEGRPLTREDQPAQRFKRLLIHIGLIAGMIVMIYPLLWMVGASFRPPAQIFTAINLFPGLEDFTLENYRNGWAAFGTISFGRFFRNSFIVAGLGVVGNLFACSLAAYAFARLRFPGRKWLFAIMLGTIMLPFHVTIIPQYILFLELGWINTFLPLIVPKFLGVEAFFIFLMVQFIRTLPTELDQAAAVDGCGHFQIFFRIIMPLSLPALAVTAIFTFIWTYNDFFAPLLYLTSPDMFTVPLGLRSFLDTSGESAFGALFAMSVLSLGPVFGFFLASQRLLVQGIATTGLK
jgi:multiple sugar transport system permease protein